MNALIDRVDAIWSEVGTVLVSIQFYGQIGIVVGALVVAWVLATLIGSRLKVFRQEPTQGRLHEIRAGVYNARSLLLPFLTTVALGFATTISLEVLGEAWLVRASQGVAIVVLVFSLARHFIKDAVIIFSLKWIGIPTALLFTAGVLGDVTAFLDGISITIGNISVTLYAVLRTIVVGAVLFWIGRASNDTGKRVIRTQTMFETGTR